MKYPLLADIEKAFLQIELLPADREVTKFLWVKDVTKPPVGDNLVIFRFKRVPFGVISSPFLLAATVRYHFAQYDEPITNEMSENAYVDNIMMGGETLEDILGKYRRSREIMDEYLMNLREFVTNAPGFNKSVPMEHRLDTNTPKVLGIPWYLTDDSIILKFPQKPCQPLSRRTVLKTLAGVFDPLGLVSPCLLQGKLMFQ
jgi:hypothetical protein